MDYSSSEKIFSPTVSLDSSFNSGDMNLKKVINRTRPVAFLYNTLLLTFCLFLIGPSYVCALDFEKGDFSLDVDTTISYSAAIRATDGDSAFLADANGDDGNRNFEKGDFTTNRFMATIDVDARFKNVGVFVRPRYFYDFAYDGSNSNDSPLTNNNLNIYGGPLSKTDEFTSKTKDAHRDKFEILDAFVYGNHSAGGNLYEMRVGQQVVSWGESVFLANGIASAQSPLDATQAFAPGVELRDIYLPTRQIMARASLQNGFSLEGYYQWEWEESRLPEAGSFFSYADYLDEAGQRLLLGDLFGLGVMNTLDRSSDKDAKDDGQYGIALRYLAESLNATEFGFYYINYHDKTPMLKSEYDDLLLLPNFPSLGTYWLEYQENIKLYGFSFGTVIGSTNVGMDVTYRDGAPMIVTDLTKPLTVGYVKGNYFQTQASFSHLFAGNKLWDQMIVLGEVGFGLVTDVDSGDIDDLTGDEFSWGGSATFTPSWFNVFPGIDFALPVNYTFNPKGNSPLATFTEKSDKLGVSLDTTYLQNFTVSIGYVNFLNSSTDNLYADRDYYTLNMKYTF